MVSMISMIDLFIREAKDDIRVSVIDGESIQGQVVARGSDFIELQIKGNFNFYIYIIPIDKITCIEEKRKLDDKVR